MTFGGNDARRIDLCFNPHPHTEGDFTRTVLLNDRMSFNPHPHTEGDDGVYFIDLFLDVSIHTLTRRVTRQSSKGSLRVLVSIHTLTRRVTHQG